MRVDGTAQGPGLLTTAVDDPLRVLLVDDSEIDIKLNLLALRGLARPLLTECVDSAAALAEALRRFQPDVILGDFLMPGFSGWEALAIANELAPGTPFIYVSGTIGEDRAIEAIRDGATDYVFKHNLRRLPQAIERALLEVGRYRERQQLQAALRKSEERFRTIVETTEDWVWEIDRAGRLVYNNDSIRAMLGVEPEQVIGREVFEFLLPDDREEARELLGRDVPSADGAGWNALVRHWRHQDGSVRMLESTARPMLDEVGNIVGYRGIDRDVTLRTQQASKIKQLARMQAVLRAHGSAVLRAKDADELLDLTCRVVVDQGHFMAAAIGRPVADNVLELTSACGDPGVIAMIRSLGPSRLDSPAAEQRPSAQAFLRAERIISPNYALSDAPAALREAMAAVGVAAQIALPIGSPPWAVLGLFSAAPQEFDDDEIALLDQLTAEIDYAHDFLAKSERLQYLAYHNAISGLPSRTAFNEQIDARIAREPHMVVLVDIDRFRYFNRSRGRRFGDHLLRAVGTRLLNMLPADALFAHPGDDAFLFACPWAESLEPALAHVRSMLEACGGSSLLVEGEEIMVRLHASVLLAPAHAVSADAIEQSLAAVLAEARDRDQLVFGFTEEVRMRATRRNELERDLRIAVAQGAFELFLQPKFTAASPRLTGAEALLRWRHPERGLISPAEFIPVLEESGLVIEVGAWVRREGLAILRQWHERGIVGLRVAVNVSARELRHVDFVGDCTALLEPFQGEHGLDIEITESMLMDDIGKSVQVLQALRSLGCNIAIDDFGTGYSSLNYLSRLPADTLKIDQSFTNALALSPDTLSLVTNIIGLAHSLGLKVVAEGVEEEEQAKLLRLLRCDELQGYHLGRPMPVAEFERQFLA